MDTTLSTRNCYFDYGIDRKQKPTSGDYTMLEKDNRKMFWNLKFNYPGTYNLRIQLHMPEKLNVLPSGTLEAGVWGPGEVKQSTRTNLHPIHNNDASHRLVWFNMGTFKIDNPGLKFFFVGKSRPAHSMKHGPAFGVANICFEYHESGNEEYGSPPEELEFDDTETGELETATDIVDELHAAEMDPELENYEAKPHNIYVKDTFARHDAPLKERAQPRHILPKGIVKMIEEVVPHTDEEKTALYHAEPAFLFTQTPSSIGTVGGLYRELKVTKHAPYTYYALKFSSGHVGLVLDGDNGYIKLEIEQDGDSGQKCTVIDKHPSSGEDEDDDRVCINYTYKFKQGINYKLFIRIKYMKISGIEQTVYYCYFGPKKSSGWRFVGAIAKPGKVDETVLGSSIENIGNYNGHLYERKLATGNTWVFDTNKNGLYVNNMTYATKDPNNSLITRYKDDRVEMQIGARYGGLMKESKEDVKFIITGKERKPSVPWDSVEKSFK